MAGSHQEVRPSQFILTFGPGSVIETRSGPVVTKAMDQLFTGLRLDPQDFEVWDDRLSRAELNGARITRVPTNAELGMASNDPVYPSFRFPNWSLCTDSRHAPTQVLYEVRTGCPLCPGLP